MCVPPQKLDQACEEGWRIGGWVGLCLYHAAITRLWDRIVPKVPNVNMGVAVCEVV